MATRHRGPVVCAHAHAPSSPRILPPAAEKCPEDFSVSASLVTQVKDVSVVRLVTTGTPWLMEAAAVLVTVMETPGTVTP